MIDETKELRKYVKKNNIPHSVRIYGDDHEVWFVRFSDMTRTQKEYMMSPSFASCGFSGWTGISF